MISALSTVDIFMSWGLLDQYEIPLQLRIHAPSEGLPEAMGPKVSTQLINFKRFLKNTPGLHAGNRRVCPVAALEYLCVRGQRAALSLLELFETE